MFSNSNLYTSINNGLIGKLEQNLCYPFTKIGMILLLIRIVQLLHKYQNIKQEMQSKTTTYQIQ